MNVERHPSFDGVYIIRDAGLKILATKSLDRGFSVYGERLYSFGGEEYREWVP
jgi:fibrillarin-like pre-rRNA processing protein